MGAVVTIKVKPGTNVEELKQQVSTAIKSRTGEQVTFHVTVAKDFEYNNSRKQQSDHYK